MEKERINVKVGRPLKQDRERINFSLYFLGKDQCDLFDKATLKATQEHIGLKYVILDALDDYINGKFSISKGKYSGVYYKHKEEKKRVEKEKFKKMSKREESLLEFLRDDSYLPKDRL